VVEYQSGRHRTRRYVVTQRSTLQRPMLGYWGSGIHSKIVALYHGGGKEMHTMFRCFYMDNRMTVLWKLFSFALLSLRFCHCMCFFVVLSSQSCTMTS